MRVIILDNGLRSKDEHSYAIAASLTKHLAELQIPCKVYGFKKVAKDIRRELGCVPHFRRVMYGNIWPPFWEILSRRLSSLRSGAPADLSPSEADTSARLNASFEADLRRLPADTWAAGTIVLFPGLMQHQVLGLSRFLTMPPRPVEAKVVCQLMFEPSWLPWMRKSELGARTYAEAFETARPLIGTSLFFTFENDHVAETYATTFDLPALLLPIPVLRRKCQPRSGDRIRLGFFGYARAEKGFHLLPDAIARCQKAQPELEFTVQIQHHGFDRGIVQAEAAIRALPNVRILKGVLSAESYAAETGAVDIVLLPYDPVMFGLRGSAIFVESVSAARLIVASEGIWAATSIGKGEAAGEVFTPYTSAALAKAILRLCQTLPERQIEAIDRAALFEQTNSVGAYVERLFAFATAVEAAPKP